MKNKNTGDNMDTVKLETLKKQPLLYRIAKTTIKYKGFYGCILNGKKIKVVK